MSSIYAGSLRFYVSKHKCIHKLKENSKRKTKKPTQMSWFFRLSKWRPLGDSNPCYRRERAVS